MIFRRISYIIALQFTAFVFGLLMVTGMVFLTADVYQHGRETHNRLERQLLQIMNRPEKFGSVPPLPQFQRERIRILDASGRTLFAGTLYDDVPFTHDSDGDDDIHTIETGRESYDILTKSFIENGTVIGYVQVADRSSSRDFRRRVFLFLLISTAISTLTFIVGLFFARRSLKPAEHMMQRLEQFTQDASHELRTPLTAVSTSLDVALTTADNRSFIVAAKRDLNDIAILIERLLELARLDSFALKTESTDVTSLVASVIAMHEPAASAAGVTITQTLSPGIFLMADTALLRQAISNLLANAIKFNTRGGTVMVTLTKHALSVEDTGKGIAPESLKKIFDRFYQEDEARTSKKGGLGLGLSLTKRIVDLHGWSITVTSVQGKGSTFTISY